jgi:hypothetical protein
MLKVFIGHPAAHHKADHGQLTAEQAFQIAVGTALRVAGAVAGTYRALN